MNRTQPSLNTNQRCLQWEVRGIKAVLVSDNPVALIYMDTKLSR